MLDRKVTINKTIKGEDNVFTLLNEELKRLHALFHESMNPGESQNNRTIFQRKIEEFHKLIVLLAEKGATEDVQKAIRDLQNSVGDILLTDNSNENNKH